MIGGTPIITVHPRRRHRLPGRRKCRAFFSMVEKLDRCIPPASAAALMFPPAAESAFSKNAFSIRPQRMQFHGAVILGKDKHAGAVVVMEDPIKGKIVKIEVPGSCQPPDYEKCKEVVIDPAACNVYDIALKRTMTTVNDIRLIDGHLRLDADSRKREVSRRT